MPPIAQGVARRRAITAVLLLAALTGPAVAGPFENAVSRLELGYYATALREFRVLAEQGHAGAQAHLGYMYDYGYGVPQDYVLAVKWYRMAAEQGDAMAQQFLGFKYADGEGVPQDYVQAHMWLSLAGEQTDEQASREIIAQSMTAAQIAEAQRRAAEWRHQWRFRRLGVIPPPRQAWPPRSIKRPGRPSWRASAERPWYPAQCGRPHYQRQAVPMSDPFE